MTSETNLDYITDGDIARWKEENRRCEIANYVLARFAEEKLSADASLHILDKVRTAINNATQTTAWGDIFICPVVQNTMCRWREGDIEEKANRQLAIENPSQQTNKGLDTTKMFFDESIHRDIERKFNEALLNGYRRQYTELKKKYKALEELNATLQKK